MRSRTARTLSTCCWSPQTMIAGRAVARFAASSSASWTAWSPTHVPRSVWTRGRRLSQRGSFPRRWRRSRRRRCPARRSRARRPAPRRRESAQPILAPDSEALPAESRCRAACSPPARRAGPAAFALSRAGGGGAAQPAAPTDAEVGLDHRVVVLHVVRGAVSDLPSEVEHDDLLGDVHHDAHVVFDQEHRDAEGLVHVEDEARHVFLLLDRHPGHRLVEENELGLLRERTGELDALLDPVGKVRDDRRAVARDLEQVDHPLHALPLALLVTDDGRRPDHRVQQADLAVQVAPDHQVLQHGHSLEEGEVLEGA